MVLALLYKKKYEYNLDFSLREDDTEVRNPMKTSNIFFAIIFLVFSAAFIFFFQQSKAPSCDTLIVGVSSGYAPWVSVNAQGEYEGFDIDVARALAQKLNKKLVLQDCGSMSSLLLALDQKKIDVIMWGMCITKDRLARMSMVRYQGKEMNAFPLLFWGKIPAGVTSINDMCGMTVCVEPASTQQKALERYDGVIQKLTPKIDDALLAIQYGKADAALTEPALARKFIKKFPCIKVLDLPLDENTKEFGVGICINQQNKKLVTCLEKAIAELEVEGVIAQLEKRWDI
jgi:ABC-type amino acid transport substrate-binding protein